MRHCNVFLRIWNKWNSIVDDLRSWREEFDRSPLFWGYDWIGICWRALGTCRRSFPSNWVIIGLVELVETFCRRPAMLGVAVIIFWIVVEFGSMKFCCDCSEMIYRPAKTISHWFFSFGYRVHLLRPLCARLQFVEGRNSQFPQWKALKIGREIDLDLGKNLYHLELLDLAQNWFGWSLRHFIEQRQPRSSFGTIPTGIYAHLDCTSFGSGSVGFQRRTVELCAFGGILP